MIPTIPDSTLRAVYTRELPYRPDWPKNYSEAIADPVIAAILRTLARHVPTYGRRHADRARIGLAVTATLAVAPQAPAAPNACACPVGTCAGQIVNGINRQGQRCRVTVDSTPGAPVRIPEPSGWRPRSPAPPPGQIDMKRRASGEKPDEE
jgi:hypothetical protein